MFAQCSSEGNAPGSSTNISHANSSLTGTFHHSLGASRHGGTQLRRAEFHECAVQQINLVVEVHS